MKNILIVNAFLLFSNLGFASTYSVNFLWVNKTYSNEQKFLCANPDEASYREKCIQPIQDWVAKSDNMTPVNIWYDSLYTNQSALTRAKEDIPPIVKFLDVREIDLVKEHSKVFSDQFQVYFRADLLRVVVADYLARLRLADYVVYTDFNVPALSKDDLFDASTKEKLDLFGLVMAKNEAPDIKNRFENGFFILDAKNDSMLQASRKGLIDINISRAEEILKHGYMTAEQSKIAGTGLCESTFSQVVWSSYHAVFTYYLFLEMAAEIESKEEVLRKKEPYNNIDLIRSYSTIIFPSAHKSQLYNRGFAYPTQHWTFGEHGLLEHIILKAFLPQNEDRTRLAILAEKARRKNAHLSNESLKLFSVHQRNFQPETQYWQQTVRLVEEKEKNRKDAIYITFISLEPNSVMPIPTKDVKKPESHFYGKKSSLVKDDGC